MKQIIRVAHLRAMLLGMEAELGLDNLSASERDVFYAINALDEGQGTVVKSDALRRHELVRSLTQPTYHRALRSLVEKGLVQNAPGTRAGSYVVPGS